MSPTSAEPPDLVDWERAAAGVLRRSGRLASGDPDADVWAALTTTTLDGIGIPLLGTAAAVADLPDSGQPGQRPFVRGASEHRPPAGWHNRTVIDGPSAPAAAADAVSDLENGATSLWLTLGREGIGPVDLAEVLAGVYLDLAPVVLDCPDDPLGAADAFTRRLGRGVTPAPGTNLGADLFSAGLRGAGAAPTAGVVDGVAALAVRHGVLGFVVDATAVHDLGGSDAQELGYATAVGAAYLRRLTAADGPGLDVDTAASLLEFRFAATVEQLPTIAKLRAARRLWSRVCELSGVSAAASGQRQHAVTSRPMMTAYDPSVNLLRGTVAAFAAGVGGAQAVTVLPFDSARGRPDAFSRRIARNTSSLLIAESHVAEVTDPAGGAYAVEQLTDLLARAGWAEVQTIERSGGAADAVADGSVRLRIDRVAAQRDAAVARRRQPITGVSEFPDRGERPRASRPTGTLESGVRRYAAAFEALRDQPVATPVFVAALGPVAARTPRVTFVGNLLAAGGVSTVEAVGTGTAADVLAAYGGQRVVCLAGTDTSYAACGSELVAALRSRGAAYVVLAGTPGDQTVPAALVDDSCARGVDAVAFLRRLRTELLR